MKRILWASANPGKYIEAKKYISEVGIELISLDAVPGTPPEVAETADTYAGNALIKAKAYYEWSKMPSLADDSGLEVNALGGGPGVLSARYAGNGASSEANINKLLENLVGSNDRKARFVCSLVLWDGSGIFVETQGSLEGIIAQSPSGKGGFGYDSVFIPQGQQVTLATLKEQTQTVTTHRTLALHKFVGLYRTDL